jgi:peptide chain release factor 1
MIEKLEEIKLRFEEVGQLLAQPDTVTDMKRFSQLSKEYRDLEKIVIKYNEFSQAKRHLQQAKEVLEKEKDAELRELAKMEIDELQPKIERINSEIKELLIPKDPNDDKNVLLEIRAGTGGDEAAIFAGDLWRMYQRFCDRKGLKLIVLDVTEGTAGGYKEVISSVTGDGAYGLLKFESGVHRVQRVPATEQMGRVHTSAASVVALPEVEDVGDVVINPADIEIQTARSSGAGGQNVNKVLPGGTFTAWKPGACNANAQDKTLRDGGGEAREGTGCGETVACAQWRQVRKNQDLQLPSKSRYRSPHRLYETQPARNYER